MEQFHVNYLKNQFKDLARPYQYKVGITSPGELEEGKLFLAKSTKIPSITVKEFTYIRAGQKLYIPTGEVEHGDASITFYNDANFDIRDFFNDWIKTHVHDYITNTGVDGSKVLGGIVTIYHYDYKDTLVQTIVLRNAWPKNMSEIELTQDSENTVEEFTVDFNYTYQEIS